MEKNDELRAVKGQEANFYSVLGVNPSASSAEINKSYRKLSLELHPDKNPDTEPQRLYTLLTSISTILKDEGKRTVYDGHLKRGFPLWKGTGYYYDRYKPGLVTVVVFIFVVVTLAQYFSIWAMYAVQKWRNNQDHSQMNNLNYTQLKKQLRKRNLSEEKVSKKMFQSSSNTDLLKNLEQTNDPQIRIPSIFDLALFTLPIWLFKTMVAFPKTLMPKEKIDEIVPSVIPLTPRMKKRKFVSTNPRKPDQMALSRSSSTDSSLHSLVQEENEEKAKTGPFSAEEETEMKRLLEKYPIGKSFI